MSAKEKILHQLTENTKLLQKAVLVLDGKALLLRRSKDAHSRPGAWDLPGGNSEWPSTKINKGGLHKADLVREVSEETGLGVDESVVDITNIVYFNTYFEALKQIYTIIAIWWIELPEGFPEDSIELSNEHTEFAWATLDELANYDFGGAAGEWLRESIENALEYSEAVHAHEHAQGHGEKEGCCGGGGCGNC